jgi:hypothetical protein
MKDYKTVLLTNTKPFSYTPLGDKTKEAFFFTFNRKTEKLTTLNLHRAPITSPGLILKYLKFKIAKREVFKGKYYLDFIEIVN